MHPLFVINTQIFKDGSAAIDLMHLDETNGEYYSLYSGAAAPGGLDELLSKVADAILQHKEKPAKAG